MSDELLSQEEIDALLAEAKKEAPAGPEPVASPAPQASMPSAQTSVDIDKIKLFYKNLMQPYTFTIETMVGIKLNIVSVETEIIKGEELSDKLRGSYLAFKTNLTGELNDISRIILELEAGRVISDILLGGNGKDLSSELQDVHISALSELVNGLMGNFTTSFAKELKKTLTFSPIEQEQIDISAGKIPAAPDKEIVFTRVLFNLENLLTNAVFYQIDSVDTFVGALAAPSASVPAAQPPAPAQSAPAMPAQPQPTIAATTGIPPMPTPQAAATPHSVQSLQMPDFKTSTASQMPVKNIELLFDVPMEVSVELGRTKMLLKDVLNLGTGAIIELDKLAGEPVDLLVNGKPLAKGEVVVIDENFGIRVTEIVGQIDVMNAFK